MENFKDGTKHIYLQAFNKAHSNYLALPFYEKYWFETSQSLFTSSLVCLSLKAYEKIWIFVQSKPWRAKSENWKVRAQNKAGENEIFSHAKTKKVL